MNEWSDALKTLAPAAGKPGMGQGNIPYAPGVMSGKYPGLTNHANDYYGKLQQTQPRTQPQAQIGGVNMPVAGQPQAAPMVWGPEQQAATLQYLMSLLNPQNPGMKLTTTGGYMPEQTEGY